MKRNTSIILVIIVLAAMLAAPAAAFNGQEARQGAAGNDPEQIRPEPTEAHMAQLGEALARHSHETRDLHQAAYRKRLALAAAMAGNAPDEDLAARIQDEFLEIQKSLARKRRAHQAEIIEIAPWLDFRSLAFEGKDDGRSREQAQHS